MMQEKYTTFNFMHPFAINFYQHCSLNSIKLLIPQEENVP